MQKHNSSRIASIKSYGRVVASVSVVGCLLFLLLSASCGRKEAALTIAVNSDVEGEALRAAAREYAAKEGVNIEVKEYDYAALLREEQNLAAPNSKFDVIMLDDPWMPNLAGKNLLTNLDALLEEEARTKNLNLQNDLNDFVPESLSLCRNPYPNGSLFALPYVGNSQLYCYRKDLFDKYNLPAPQTWPDVLRAAQTLKDKQNSSDTNTGDKIYGYVMRGAQGNDVVTDFLPIFWAYGANMFDTEGHATVNSKEAKEALRFVLDLYQTAPEECRNYNADEVNERLRDGTAAQSINWPAWMLNYRDRGDWQKIPRVEFTHLPVYRNGGKAVIGNWLLAIPRRSPNTAAAFKFIRWLTNEEQMRASAKRGNPPTRQSIYGDGEIKKMYPTFEYLLASLKNSRPRERMPQWLEIEKVFGDHLNKAISKEETVDDALDRANEEITRIMASSGT
jgi:multiple sugar transport system substrate-binding protein